MGWPIEKVELLWQSSCSASAIHKLQVNYHYVQITKIHQDHHMVQYIPIVFKELWKTMMSWIISSSKSKAHAFLVSYIWHLAVPQGTCSVSTNQSLCPGQCLLPKSVSFVSMWCKRLWKSVPKVTPGNNCDRWVQIPTEREI